MDHFKVKSKVYWLFNYFTNRKQWVIVDPSIFSSYLPCRSGIPQGSILGLVLFYILLDPCLHKTGASKTICYADDCTFMNKIVFGQVNTLLQDVNEFLESPTNQTLSI